MTIAGFFSIFGIEHLVRRREPRFLHRGDVERTDTADSPHDVGGTVRIGLNEHSLIPHALGAGLIRIDSGDQNQLILNPFVELSEPGNIFENGRALVSGTGADDEEHFLALAGNDGFYLLVAFVFELFKRFGKRRFRDKLLRFRDIALFLQHIRNSFFNSSFAFFLFSECIL